MKRCKNTGKKEFGENYTAKQKHNEDFNGFIEFPADVKLILLYSQITESIWLMSFRQLSTTLKPRFWKLIKVMG